MWQYLGVCVTRYDLEINLLSKMSSIEYLGVCVTRYDLEINLLSKMSAIELAKNTVNHERSKHIDVRFHFIRDYVKEGSVELLHVVSQDEVADIFTKPLPKVLFEKYKKMISMTNGRSILQVYGRVE